MNEIRCEKCNRVVFTFIKDLIIYCKCGKVIRLGVYKNTKNINLIREYHV